MMPKKNHISLFLLFVLSACSTTYQSTESKLKGNVSTVKGLLNASRNSDYKKSFSLVKNYENGVYIGLKSFSVKQGEDLPVRVEAEGVKLYSSRKMTLDDIAKLIMTATGIPVSVMTKSDSTTTNSASGMDSNGMYQKLDAVVGKDTSPLQMLDLYENMPGMDVDFKGKLSDFLKMVSSYFGISWQYLNGVIYFSHYEVRTFTINALPVKLNSSGTMNIGLSSGAGGGGGSSGGSSSNSGGDGSGGGDTLATASNSKFSLNMDVWGDIKKNLSIILRGNGSFNVAEGLASVTVSTTPDNMANVQRYIDKLNEKLRQEITVNITVYNLTLNDDSDWNYSLTAMFSALKGRITGDMSFLTGASGGMQGTTTNGSKFILSLLDSQGKVNLLNSANVTTMSGQPVPLQVANTRGYVSTIGSTVSNNTTQSNVSVSTIDSGFALNVLPRVLDDGKILLQYSINLSSLVGKNNGFDLFTVGKQSIQLPDVNQRAFVQQSLMKSNQTLVVAGYKNENTQNSDSGVGSPKFKLLGGAKLGKSQNEIIVICITPVALTLGDE